MSLRVPPNPPSIHVNSKAITTTAAAPVPAMICQRRFWTSGSGSLYGAASGPASAEDHSAGDPSADDHSPDVHPVVAAPAG